MRAVIISDTHEKHRQIFLPEGDILIHCGDWTFTGAFNKVADFIHWMKEQDFKYKCIIAGNHELSLDHRSSSRNMILNLIKESGIIYLEDSLIEIEGIKFYGAPWQPEFHSWAFNLPRGFPLANKWKQIPNDVNVLITHGPPYGILDDTTDNGSQGCEELAKRVKQLPNLKLHCFGHLHHSGGKIEEHNNIKFVNAAVCTDAYKPTNLPVIIDI
jgi:Icc-related predicted phosphoesterase